MPLWWSGPRSAQQALVELCVEGSPTVSWGRSLGLPHFVTDEVPHKRSDLRRGGGRLWATVSILENKGSVSTPPIPAELM